jgi:hypothetical protein
MASRETNFSAIFRIPDNRYRVGGGPLPRTRPSLTLDISGHISHAT